MADRKISELNTLTGLNVADDDKLVIVDASADETKAITAAQLRVAIGNSAFNFTDDVIIAGDLSFTGGGVYLGGTGSANYLDDYEEGTWTPTVVANTGAALTGISYTSQKGDYTKVGNVVHVGITISFTANSGLSMGRISLPITIGGTVGNYPASAITAIYVDFSGGTYVLGYTTTGYSYITLTSNGDGVAQANPKTTTGAMLFRVSLTYRTA